MNHVLIHKHVGQTPLQAIEEWKSTNPEYQDIPATYAGRLDPMAEGLLIVLLGDECKKKEEYIGLDKEYEIEVLLGVGSDTGDVLGIVRKSTSLSAQLTETNIQTVLTKEIGTHSRPYPAFSSKTVNGKPLFLYALEGTLDSIQIPEHSETIHSIEYIGTMILESNDLRSRVESMLTLAPVSDEPSKILGADFRIDAVRNSWDVVFAEPGAYTILTLRVNCGSGAYMRTLAERIGTSLGTNALALSIKRTQVGPYTIDQSV